MHDLHNLRSLLQRILKPVATNRVEGFNVLLFPIEFVYPFPLFLSAFVKRLRINSSHARSTIYFPRVNPNCHTDCISLLYLILLDRVNVCQLNQLLISSINIYIYINFSPRHPRNIVLISNFSGQIDIVSNRQQFLIDETFSRSKNRIS